MTDTPASPPAADAPPEDTPDSPRDWGRVLDIAGAVAGVVLVVIVADIVSDGRVISRRLQAMRARREGQADDRAE